MPGKSLNPEQITQAVAMRAAGFTLAAISERLGASIRTLQRVFERHRARKGEVTTEAVQSAKRDLIEGLFSTERLKEEISKLIADEIAHARLLRERIANASEHLTANNLSEAAIVMRSAAAYSTALKNTSDMLRHTLRPERILDAEEEENLPVLVVREIKDEEVLKVMQHPDIKPLDEADDALCADDSRDEVVFEHEEGGPEDVDPLANSCQG